MHIHTENLKDNYNDSYISVHTNGWSHLKDVWAAFVFYFELFSDVHLYRYI